MLQTEYASWTMVKQMHKDHVSAAASLDILLMIAGARKWTAITAGGGEPCSMDMLKQKEQR